MDINKLLEESIKSGDKVRTETLKLIKSKMTLEMCKPGRNQKELSESEVLVILGKMKNEYLDSISQFKKAGREDLVESETKELEIIESFLPKEPTEEEIEKFIDSEISKLPHEPSMKDMKPLIEISKSEFPLSGKTVSKILLSKLKR